MRFLQLLRTAANATLFALPTVLIICTASFFYLNTLQRPEFEYVATLPQYSRIIETVTGKRCYSLLSSELEDPHKYELTAQKLAILKKCKTFVVTSAIFDKQIMSQLEALNNKPIIIEAASLLPDCKNPHVWNHPRFYSKLARHIAAFVNNGSIGEAGVNLYDKMQKRLDDKIKVVSKLTANRFAACDESLMLPLLEAINLPVVCEKIISKTCCDHSVVNVKKVKKELTRITNESTLPGVVILNQTTNSSLRNTLNKYHSQYYDVINPIEVKELIFDKCPVQYLIDVLDLIEITLTNHSGKARPFKMDEDANKEGQVSNSKEEEEGTCNHKH